MPGFDYDQVTVCEVRRPAVLGTRPGGGVLAATEDQREPLGPITYAIHFGAGECTTCFDAHPGVQGLDPHPYGFGPYHDCCWETFYILLLIVV